VEVVMRALPLALALSLEQVAVFDMDLVKAGRTKPADLLQAKVLYTIVGGKVVYEAGGRAGRERRRAWARPTLQDAAR
jgi:hypothetical protein